MRPVQVQSGVSVVIGGAGGAQSQSWIEVRGPLKPGELVVVEGNERINPMRRVIMVNKKDSTRKTAK